MGWYGFQVMVSGCSGFHHLHLELEPDDRVEAMSLASLVSGLGAVPLHFLWLSPSVASTGQTWYCLGLPHIPSSCKCYLPTLWSGSLRCRCTLKSPSRQEDCSVVTIVGRGVLEKEWLLAESSWSGPGNCPQVCVGCEGDLMLVALSPGAL